MSAFCVGVTFLILAAVEHDRENKPTHFLRHARPGIGSAHVTHKLSGLKP